jgi:peptidyl-prolyl cis-trans isomerase A (cyclophilin A)
MRIALTLAAATLVPVLLCAQTAHTKPASTAAKPATAAAVPPVPLPTEPGKYAIFYTTLGNIVCKLDTKEAPKTVANFVGLATGIKAWKDPHTGAMKKSPFYNGLTFHRVISGFMIQGGDPVATGMGGPGYSFDDEINPLLDFSQTGILAMANAGPNTNGSQFFITVAPQPRLDGHYSIFGKVVSGQDVAIKISETPRNEEDKPLTPVKMTRIVIRDVGATPAKPATGTKPTVTTKPAAAKSSN